jgi:hypothetical protein
MTRKPLTDTKTLSGREFAEQQAAIAWYASIVTWLLNRTEHTPFAIKELIREASHERSLKFGPREQKDEHVKD